MMASVLDILFLKSIFNIDKKFFLFLKQKFERKSKIAYKKTFLIVQIKKIILIALVFLSYIFNLIIKN